MYKDTIYHINNYKKNYHKNLLNKKNSSSQLPNKMFSKNEKKKKIRFVILRECLID